MRVVEPTIDMWLLRPGEAGDNLLAFRRRLRKAFPVLTGLISGTISPTGEQWREAFYAWRDEAKPARLIDLRTELDDMYRLGLRFDQVVVIVQSALGLDESVIHAEGGVLQFLCNLEDRLVEWMIVHMPNA